MCEFFAKHDILVFWFLVIGIVRFAGIMFDALVWLSKEIKP